jgi:hypothetical protein
MCFYNSSNGIGLVAQKPIKAFKLFVVTSDEQIKSPFRKSFWKKGSRKSVNIKFTTRRNEINKGLHAFTSVKAALEYHFREAEHVVHSVIIPKGAYYVKNADGQIIANTMILGDKTRRQR